MSIYRGLVLPVVALVVFSGCRNTGDPVAGSAGDEAVPPLDLKFGRSCGLPEGRKQAYDAETGEFHVHFGRADPIGSPGSGLFERSSFEVTKVNGPFVKPVVFRLSGVPTGFGCVGFPLSLCVGPRDDFRVDGKCYALVDDPLATGPVDKNLFRVERKGDVVTVGFTEKGQSLLIPGVMFSFKVDTGW